MKIIQEVQILKLLPGTEKLGYNTYRFDLESLTVIQVMY